MWSPATQSQIGPASYTSTSGDLAKPHEADYNSRRAPRAGRVITPSELPGDDLDATPLPMASRCAEVTEEPDAEGRLILNCLEIWRHKR